MLVLFMIADIRFLFNFPHDQKKTYQFSSSHLLPVWQEKEPSEIRPGRYLAQYILVWFQSSDRSQIRQVTWHTHIHISCIIQFSSKNENTFRPSHLSSDRWRNSFPIFRNKRVIDLLPVIFPFHYVAEVIKSVDSHDTDGNHRMEIVLR